MSDTVDKPASARSPLAGCAILIAALLVMVFLIVFSTITLFRQFDEIVKFTADEAKPVAIEPLAGRDAEVAALNARLAEFRAALEGDSEARLELGAGDLNLAIAAHDHFKELRGTFRVEAIEDGVLRIAVSFPLNGKPRLTKDGEQGLIASDNRYLNGTLMARPRLMKQEVVLKLDDIVVDGAKVPDEFIQQMSPYRLMERYLVDPVLGPAMAGLTRVEVVGDQVVAVRVPGAVAEGEMSEEDVGAASSRFFKVLGGAVCLFLLFAGTMVFVGLKKKAGDA